MEEAEIYNFKEVKDIIKEKSILLMKHEEKNHATAGVPFSNYRILDIEDRKFVLVLSDIFIEIIEKSLVRAVFKQPSKFGTKNAYDVLEALYNIDPIFSLDSFIYSLKNEQFCYVVEIKDGIVLKDVLRIDLFRQLEKNVKNEDEFIGGILHCLKHFTFNDMPLSTHSELNNIENIYFLIEKIIETYYFGKKLDKKNKSKNAELELGQNYKFHLGYFYESNTKVSFLNTFYKKTTRN